MSFQDIESRINETVAMRLYNRMVTVNGISIRAIFDNQFGTTFTSSGAEMKTVEPVLQVKTSDLQTPVRGSVVILDNVNYKVIAHQPDGTGWSTLELEKS